MSWLRYLGLTVPLAALRSYLYMATTATTSLFVLLPIAMITYDQYYKTLIPNESSPIIPLNFTTTTITYKNLKLSSNNNNNNNNNNNHISNTKNILISNAINPIFQNYQYDDQLIYIFNINIQAICLPHNNLQHEITKINYELISSTTTETTNDKNDNNNDNDDNNNNKSFKQGSIILNCDPYVIYSQNNQFIPFNFRFWLSPYLIEHSQINNINLLPLEIPGDQLKNWNNFKIILNNNNNDNINNQVSTPTAAQNQEIRYLIDDNFSWIQFDVKWTGFRYYMVKYYYSCYLIGTIIFFMVSAGVGFFTSYTILLLNNRNKL